MSDTSDPIPQDHNAPPPKPRKLPQQGRSRILFESVKEACYIIIKEKGPRELTATRIAEVSGVAMGSLYQYFPNVDAIRAAIYDDMVMKEINAAVKLLDADMVDLPLVDALGILLNGSLSFHRRMLDLDQEFHQKFYQSYELQDWFDLSKGQPKAAEVALRKVLIAHQHEFSSNDPEMTAFILMSAYRSIILDAICFHPEYLGDPEFLNYTVNFSLSILGYQPTEKSK